jgi:hypothetical protein
MGASSQTALRVWLSPLLFPTVYTTRTASFQNGREPQGERERVCERERERERVCEWKTEGK